MALPEIGLPVFMKNMGDDVQIEIVEIPEAQPFADCDSIFVILDQYDEYHLVELDGDGWCTVNPETLSGQQYDQWLDIVAGVGVALYGSTPLP